jgi:hypothetical protein
LLAITAICAGLWFGALAVTRAATIGGEPTGLGIVEAGGGADRRLPDPVTATRLKSMPSAIDARSPGAIAADRFDGTRKDGSAAFFGRALNPISDLDIAALGIPAGLPPVDSEALQSLFDDFWLTASSSTIERLDAPLKARQASDDPAPWWAIDLSWLAKGDIYVEVAVPALALVALLVAGLLLFALARRRRRTAWARRIKRSAGRQRPRSSS